MFNFLKQSIIKQHCLQPNSSIYFSDSKDSGTGSSEDGERPAHRLDLLHASGGAGGFPVKAESEWSESRADSGPDSPECLFDQREPRHPLQLQHPAYLASSRLLRHPSPEATSPGSHHIPPSTSATSTGTATTKPRIWSLADMASKDGDHPSPNSGSLMSPYPSGGGSAGGGKIVSPLASRLPPHHPLHPAMHPGSQFVRPHPDIFRNFYGSPHLGSGDISLFETYSRTLGGLSGTSNILNSSSSSSTEVKPFSTDVKPFPSDVKPFSPDVKPFSSDIKPFSQDTKPFASDVKPFSVNGGPGTRPSGGVLTSSSGVSPSSSSSASSGGSDQSPHPSGNHPPTELKSPGRV